MLIKITIVLLFTEFHVLDNSFFKDVTCSNNHRQVFLPGLSTKPGLVCYTLMIQCIGLPCTALHCPIEHFPLLHWTALYFTALHCTAQHCNTLHCPVIFLSNKVHGQGVQPDFTKLVLILNLSYMYTSELLNVTVSRSRYRVKFSLLCAISWDFYAQTKNVCIYTYFSVFSSWFTHIMVWFLHFLWLKNFKN